MIYPSLQKYEQSRQQPYVAFRNRLAWFLGQQDAVLIISGFSFGDDHINDLLFRALENHPRTHIYALQFREEPEDSDLTKRAEQHRNILVVGPKTAVISGRRLPWYASNVPAVLGNVIRSRSNGDKEDDVEVGIGDFAIFCQFIESMTERD